MKKCLENYNDNFQENLSRPGIVDARVRYRAAARRLRNTGLSYMLHFSHQIAVLEAPFCSVPGRIMAAYCDGDGGQDRTGFEAYVTPGFPMTYRIHTVFLNIKRDITLKVRK
jgi:hypothetical protein